LRLAIDTRPAKRAQAHGNDEEIAALVTRVANPELE
jgi:hypothetical protein